ncbi:hypothetical protein ACE103_17665 [Bradyrhizobium sp. ma5]|uniref:hypothetical protein n=1 Tax=Bradyrhizobium sp. ma5 TaxID=3344828 RepID=UPI0035D423A9
MNEPYLYDGMPQMEVTTTPSKTVDPLTGAERSIDAYGTPIIRLGSIDPATGKPVAPPTDGETIGRKLP